MEPPGKKRRKGDVSQRDPSAGAAQMPGFGTKKKRSDVAATQQGPTAAAEVQPHRGAKRPRSAEEEPLSGLPSSEKSGRARGKKRRVASAAWPPASAEQLAAAGRVVRAVARGSHGWPFSAPVTDEVAPGYSKEIKHPMDLGTVSKQLKHDVYSSLGALLFVT
jgi:hypothetical protein